MSDAIHFSGDVNVSSISIFNRTNAAGVDIRPQVMSIQIFESIFYEFITAVIHVQDTGDVISGMNLTGEEVVIIAASVPTMENKVKSISLPFHLYAVKDGTKSSDRSKVYTLNCISLESAINNNRRFSKSLKGRISDIVKDLITDTSYGLAAKKTPIIEETSNNISYVSNYWTPARNIDFLKSRAMSVDNSPTYLFFENRDGFNFITMERLYKNKSIATLVKDNNVSKDASSGGYNTILDLEVNTICDYYKNTKSGTYANTLQTFDIITKQVKIEEYSPFIDKSVQQLNTQNPYPLWITANPSAAITTSTTSYNVYEGVDDVTDTAVRQKHSSVINMSRLHTIKVLVAGRNEYSAGYVVDVNMPKDAANISGDPTDYMLSGRYVIAEVNHMINGSEYRCVMSLIKNSVVVK